MPGMTGLDLLQAVRADSKLATLPVLMVTAESTREQIVQARTSGGKWLYYQTFYRLQL